MEKIDTQLVLEEMIKYDEADLPRIQHIVKVNAFAKMLGHMEGLDERTRYILDIASILHDIGIHPAEAKYGNCQGKYQEELGPDEARKLLTPFQPEPEVLERVCYLIAHHHTYTNVDGMDYQILLEADFLVNAFEDGLEKSAIIEMRDRVFKTVSGIRILNEMFGVDGPGDGSPAHSEG